MGSLLLWLDQRWLLSIKKPLTIRYHRPDRPRPQCGAPQTFRDVPSGPSCILCPTLYCCILHALLNSTEYYSTGSKKLEEKEILYYNITPWNECQVHFLSDSQCSEPDFIRVGLLTGRRPSPVVVGTIYHLLLRAIQPLIQVQNALGSLWRAKAGLLQSKLESLW